MTNTAQPQRSTSNIHIQTMNIPLLASVVFALAVLTAPMMPAQTYTVLHRFSGPDGSMPRGKLIGDAKGRLYGTTMSGGQFDYYGTVYVLSIATGRVTLLHSFNYLDGSEPMGGLLRDGSGNVYGTTGSGTANGEVYELDRAGAFTVLHTFSETEGYAGGGSSQRCRGKLVWGNRKRRGLSGRYGVQDRYGRDFHCSTRFYGL